jgi:hypothetical protein
MTPLQAAPATTVALAVDVLDHLIRALKERGFEVVGPTVRDGAIIYDSINELKDLPQGWRAEQSPGRYDFSGEALS